MTDEQRKAAFLGIVAAIRDTLPDEFRTLEAVAWFTSRWLSFERSCQAWAKRWRVPTQGGTR